MVSPRLKEHNELSRALDPKARERVGGWFGSNALPKFSDLVYLRSLDPALLPSDKKPTADNPKHKRLIVIGDVHGCLDECELYTLNCDLFHGSNLVHFPPFYVQWKTFYKKSISTPRKETI